MRNDKVYITCYGARGEYRRKDAIKEFEESVLMSEGCERDRYVNILIGLRCGKKEISDEGEWC